MTDQEAKRLLKDMMDRGLGVSGHNVSNGARLLPMLDVLC